MKYILVLFLALLSPAFSRQTEVSEVILEATLNKWQHLQFTAHYGPAGKVSSYTWTCVSATRDRRGPGLYIENVFCFLHARVDSDNEENTATVREDKNGVLYRFTFSGQLNPFSEIKVRIRNAGPDASVAISGSGPVFEDFRKALEEYRKDNLGEGEGLEKGLNWTYKPRS